MTDKFLEDQTEPPIDSYELPKGVYPDEDRFHYVKIKQRALRILEGLRGDEVKQYNEDLAKLLFMARINYEEQFIEEIKASGENRVPFKDTDVIRYAHRNNQTSSDLEKKKNRWPEYFALVALWKFNHATRLVSAILTENENVLSKPDILKKHADFYLMDASEAITEAESLYEKRKTKRKAQKASRKEQLRIKAKLIEFYLQHRDEFVSMAKTVRDFIETITKDEFKKFSERNIHRTLVTHLSEYIKSNNEKGT